MNVKTFEDAIKYYFSEGPEAFLPHVSVNSAVLAYRHPHLMVLVHKIRGSEYRLLPGGYVLRSESVDEAAVRNLSLLGIREVFLRQIQTFGDVTRVFDYPDVDFINASEQEQLFNWAKQRFITVVYYGLIQPSANELIHESNHDDLEWQNLDDLGALAMDHVQIVQETHKLLKTELLNHPVLSNLLPGTFTLNELRGLFEAILNRAIDRGTFRRKMLRLEIIEQVDQRKDSLGRPSHLFRFNTENYHRFLEEENKFGF